MIKKILTYPKDRDTLSQISEEVKSIEDYKDLIQDLKDTLKDNGDTGVAISAIQIGEPKRICYINYDNREIVMINPIITWKRSGASGMKEFLEGCLSAPGKYKKVSRPQKVICQYTDENGELKEIAEGGWMSAIIQHELDHFEGICKVSE
jgi:peptide deformylase